MSIVQQSSGLFNGASFTVTLPAASSSANRVVVIVAGNTIVNTGSGGRCGDSQVNYMGHYLWDRAGGAFVLLLHQLLRSGHLVGVRGGGRGV